MTQVRSRVDTVPLVAGIAVLDLVNTVSWRGDPDRGEDQLRGPEECLRWARRVSVLEPAELESLRALLASPRRAASLVTGLHDLREVVERAVVSAEPVLAAEATTMIVEAYRHAELVLSTGAAGQAGARRWVIRTVDEHTASRRLALQLDRLLTGADGRIGTCADPACGWVFLDTSRARNRRWCSSADCGNRFRVREHQRRRNG